MISIVSGLDISYTSCQCPEGQVQCCSPLPRGVLADEVTNNNVLGLRSGERLPVIIISRHCPAIYLFFYNR